LKIATWNVNSVAIRVERLLAFLERERPDVVCLQELKCADDRFPAEVIAKAGYTASVFGQKTYNGVAVLTLGPHELVARGFGDRVDDAHARFLAVQFGGITIASAYIPNGQEVGSEKFFYKLNWLARLRRWLDHNYLPTDPVMVLGDYNVAPTDLDVANVPAWRGSILCSPRERQALADVMAFGLLDSYRELEPQGRAYSWWDYRAGAFQRDDGLRIDLILVTAPVMKRIKAVRADRDERAGEKPSDHVPVIAELRQ
jgi:exodeoxyribonuclease-3